MHSHVQQPHTNTHTHTHTHTHRTTGTWYLATRQITRRYKHRPTGRHRGRCALGGEPEKTGMCRESGGLVSDLVTPRGCTGRKKEHNEKHTRTHGTILLLNLGQTRSGQDVRPDEVFEVCIHALQMPRRVWRQNRPSPRKGGLVLWLGSQTRQRYYTATSI